MNVFIWIDNSPPWLLSTVYESPMATYRQHLWEYLLQLGNLVDIPWLMLGDFNQILHPSEKKGGSLVSSSRMAAFMEVVTQCAMIDLGFSGLCFTWTNFRPGKANVQERLDKALSNRQWLQLYPATKVVHLPRSRSDHHPLFLHQDRLVVMQRRQSPFRIQAT